jgi:ribosomal protein L19E
MVSSIWQQKNRGETAIQVWQNKIRVLRQDLRWWAKNSTGLIKTEKKQLSELINLIKGGNYLFIPSNARVNIA